MQLTDTQKMEFIEYGGDICPICSDSSIEHDEPDFGDTSVSQDCQCSHCFAEWNNQYVLSAVKLLEPGKLNIKALSPLQEERYLSHGQACVICQYDNMDGSGLGLNCDEFLKVASKGKMAVSCPCCNASWNDQFELADVIITNAGKYAPVEGDAA
ncbi:MULTISPECIES: hypothetical protein [Vibrio]|uniref:hypothetical protein n=1 Tax=Vibrio TaxID=662 RepID=UPI001B836502|nr:MULTISPECIES: hypothetical protein [Vibrio]BDP38345.1 hypothetical protein VA208B3_47160 [Vibrio alginolyticus]MDF5646569.1 hypothetical protein [Vibrio parahaemolyticus]MDF5666173.1 hypothetical protein [Vibrio parahaemolyticus]WKV19427.1 hypothetical protein [Vibrio parahaemolyticus]BDP33411.1 hypothetical protein VV208B2_44910 [Vibrio vulnificus]